MTGKEFLISKGIDVDKFPDCWKGEISRLEEFSEINMKDVFEWAVGFGAGYASQGEVHVPDETRKLAFEKMKKVLKER